MHRTTAVRAMFLIPLVMAAIGCSDDEAAVPTSSTEETTVEDVSVPTSAPATSAPATAPASTIAPETGPAPVYVGALDAGEYVTSRMDRPFTFSVGDDGWNGQVHRADALYLTRGGISVEPDAPFPPGLLLFDLAGVSTIDEAIAALDRSDQLTLGSPEPGTLFGFPSVTVAPEPFDGDVPIEVLRLDDEGGTWVAVGANANEIRIALVDGTAVVAWLESDPEQFEDFRSTADELLATVVFEGIDPVG